MELKGCLLMAVCTAGYLISGSDAFPTNVSSNAALESGCMAYRWKPFHALTEQDVPVEVGVDRRNTALFSCRFPVDGKMVVGKAILQQQSCWVSYEGREVGSRGSLDFQVLTSPDPTIAMWTESQRGEPIPLDSFGGGQDTYIARCGWETGWGYEVTPGAVHRETRQMFVPFGGAVHECEVFEVMVCPVPIGQEIIPAKAV